MKVPEDIGPDSVGEIFAAPHRPAMGQFQLYFAGQRWVWSDEVAQMHGYEPGTVEPTTELVLSHKHPDDRERVGTAVGAMLDEGRPFSSRYRIIDAQGREHHVLVVAAQMTDESGSLIGTEGFYVDLTDFRDSAVQDTMDQAVSQFAESRAVIEQAKGMMMIVYGIDSDRAFDVLKWRSQETNTKLRLLAAHIVGRAAAISEQPPTTWRNGFDEIILTGHLA